MLNTRGCLPDEPFSNYMAELKKLTEFYGYGERMGTVLMERFVCDIAKKHIQQSFVGDK